MIVVFIHYFFNNTSTCKRLLLLCLLLAQLKPDILFGQTNFKHEQSLPLTIGIINYDSNEIETLLDLAAEIEKGEPERAIKILNEALLRSKQSNNPHTTMKALLSIGRLELNLGRYNNSCLSLEEGLKIATIVGDNTYALTILDLLSTAYQMQGNYDDAAVSLYKAINIAKDSGVPMIRRARIYNNLGALLLRMDQASEGLYYLNTAIMIGKRADDYSLQASALMNRGIIYALRKEWNQSEVDFQAALLLANQHGLEELQHNILLNLASGYIDQGLSKKALSHLHRAESMLNVGPYYQNGALIEIGRAYYNLKEYDKSKYYLEKSLNYGLTANLNNDIKEAHNYLSMLFEEVGDYTKALEHHKNYLHYKDMIEGEAVKKDVNRLEQRYQSARKDNELVHKKLLISQQEKKLAKKDLWITGIASSALLLSLILISIYRNNRQKERLQSNRIRILQQEQELLRREQQIGQLKSMMKGEEKERRRISRELHDGIGGMLTAIKMNLGSASTHNPELRKIPAISDVMNMLQDTSSEVRKVAHNLMPDILIKLGLEEALLLYCSHITNSELKIDVQFQGELENLDTSIELLLYRIAQELLQNIVKHSKATYAILQIMEYQGRLSLVVEDNGCGFNVNEHTGGFGLQNLQYRVQALEGSISIESTKERNTTILIAFDLPKLNKSIAL